MSLGRTFKLNSGYEIPAVGLGTWLSKPHEVENAVEVALRKGYRHIDAAACYQNENEVGNGWKKSGVPREEIFITSKLWNTHHHPDHVEEALNKTLSDLQTDYLDLYLIHWPVAFEHTNETLTPIDPVTKRFRIADVPVADTWAALEKFVDAGAIRSIGISNFTVEATQALLKTAKIPPAVNQIEAHPYLLQPQLFDFLKEKDILPVAYSPLGNNLYNLPRVVDDPTVVEIAKKLNKDPAILLVSWAIQRGSAVLPKSVTPSRIESNFQDFVIPDAEFDALNKLDRNERYNYPFRWGVDVFGELGAAEAERRAEEHAAKLRESSQV
ncbi:Putative Aldo-keto reductase [Penicillium brasilianum]|uniref:D-xylose reductase [NAD(P)H] n=1 Tax=Penicillium brasilianum TaxID=104259 RepID=A0A0F7TFA6_PENBI|nr:Putative Aldo-keto reductase [Penicillium brasilianum]